MLQVTKRLRRTKYGLAKVDTPPGLEQELERLNLFLTRRFYGQQEPRMRSETCLPHSEMLRLPVCECCYTALAPDCLAAWCSCSHTEFFHAECITLYHCMPRTQYATFTSSHSHCVAHTHLFTLCTSHCIAHTVCLPVYLTRCNSMCH